MAFFSFYVCVDSFLFEGVGRCGFPGVLLLLLKSRLVDGHGMAGEHLFACTSSRNVVCLCLMVYTRWGERFEMRKSERKNARRGAAAYK